MTWKAAATTKIKKTAIIRGLQSNVSSDYAVLSIAASREQILMHFQQDFIALNL